MDGIELDEPVLQGKLPMGGDYDDEGNHDGHKGHHKGRCSSKYSTSIVSTACFSLESGDKKRKFVGERGVGVWAQLKGESSKKKSW